MKMKSIAGIICLVKDLEKVTEFYEALGFEFKKQVPGISATVPEAYLKKTDHVAEWKWFSRDEFMQQDLHASYDKTQLAGVIFDREKN